MNMKKYTGKLCKLVLLTSTEQTTSKMGGIILFFSLLSPSLRLCFSFLLADVFQQGKPTVSCLLFLWLCSFGRVSSACRGLWGFTFFCGRIMGALGGTVRMMARGGLKCHQHSRASTVQPLLLPLDLAWGKSRGWTVGAEPLGRGSWPGASPRAGLLWACESGGSSCLWRGLGGGPCPSGLLHQGQLQLGQGPHRPPPPGAFFVKQKCR